MIKWNYMSNFLVKWGEPAITSTSLQIGGVLGNPAHLPDIPLEETLLDESHNNNLLTCFKRNGFSNPIAYYLNDTLNEEYAERSENNGVLDFPILFIDTKRDTTCTLSMAPKMAEEQERYVENLTFETIEAGHWPHLERPAEINKLIKKWLVTKLGFVLLQL
ncbi:hypothetical protein GT037_005564 [Alternaria burnsii]|uniref:Uncharacterized protein n=1 Tax=Alternaria burnsii TaxID=1187904 RepID=A0A8H7B461_9PLEO|nr:uncharacterized protein GT037_005564 [Alternaria burnsii]KAF7676059.1 hypothetical protein GT037_005564 [Alternaria burnsii]